MLDFKLKILTPHHLNSKPIFPKCNGDQEVFKFQCRDMEIHLEPMHHKIISLAQILTKILNLTDQIPKRLNLQMSQI